MLNEKVLFFICLFLCFLTLNIAYADDYDDIAQILQQGSNLNREMKKNAFVDNWKALESKYPRVAKAVFEKIFSNSMPVFNYYLEYNGVEGVRAAILNYIEQNLLSAEYLGVENSDEINNNPSPDNLGKL